jgi:hypothetical protein
LLLPPSYREPVPGGYFAFQSSTYNVFLFFRTVLTQGPNGPDTGPAVAAAEQTRVYPLGSVEKERKKMQFPNASNIAVNMMYPTDFSYWEKLKSFVDYEPVEALSPEVIHWHHQERPFQSRCNDERSADARRYGCAKDDFCPPRRWSH